MDLPPALARRVGPFSVAVWLAIGAAGIGLGLIIRRSPIFADRNLDDASAELEATTDPTGSALVPGAGIAAGVPGYGIGYGGAVLLPGGFAPRGDDVDPAEGTTNEAWLRRAVTWYSDTQGGNAVSADTALRKYLQGRDVTTAERAIVTSVLARWGAPPEGAPPLDTVPDQPTAGTPGDVWYPGLRSHRTERDQTGAQVAAIYYGAGTSRAQGWARMKAVRENAWLRDYQSSDRLPNGRLIYIP